MVFKKLKQLLNTLAVWFEVSIPVGRLKENDTTGRTWILTDIGYDKKFILSDLRTITDTTDLNQLYRSRYVQDEAKARKGISAIKIEISSLYGFRKCFVQRYKGRLHFYRDDLSQKGARNTACVGQALGLFLELKQNLD